MIPLFILLIIGVISFVAIRIGYWLLVQVPKDHAKDEAICETCMGKRVNDKVTEPLEWCHCPQKDEDVDSHE